jgi:hypothetical protein
MRKRFFKQGSPIQKSSLAECGQGRLAIVALQKKISCLSIPRTPGRLTGEGAKNAPQYKIRGSQIMRFLCLYKPGKPERTPTTDEMQAMGNMIQQAMQAGWLLSTEGCMPSAAGARVRYDNDKYTVIDGPFAETRELVGGFAIIRADSKAQAIEITKNFLKATGGGESEIRQLYEAPADATGPA